MSTKLAPKGMRDILPEDAILGKQVVETIEKVYLKYGFVPMETPAMEYLATLRAKAGEEIDKQIFVLKNEKLGLRFDLSVPLARVAATNTFPKPFKRYAFAPVWRYEEPQKGRFREFWQADIDIIGSNSMRADAEILTVAREAILALGFKNPKIILNNRKILDALAAKLGIEKKKEAVFRLLDKIDKAGEKKVREELCKLIGKDKTKELLKILETKGSNKAKLEVAKKISKEGAAELEEILALCSFPVEINLALVRGLGYYTGPTFEIKADESIGSIAGGGRYDDLLGIYGRADYATGISLGIERIIALLKERQTNSKKTYTQVFVANVKPEFYKQAMKVAAELRKSGILAETDLNARNLKKQFDYANALNIPYIIVLGEKETKENKVTLRNMKSGKEELVTITEAIKTISAQ